MYRVRPKLIGLSTSCGLLRVDGRQLNHRKVYPVYRELGLNLGWKTNKWIPTGLRCDKGYEQPSIVLVDYAGRTEWS